MISRSLRLISIDLEKLLLQRRILGMFFQECMLGFRLVVRTV
jgi:hypothetical protein